MSRTGRHAGRVAAAIVLLGIGCAEIPDDTAAIVVFAASSTTNAMSELAESFELAQGIDVVCNTAASSTLARQIIAGAEFDVYLSANPLWMDAVAARDLIDAKTRIDLLGNRLALIASANASMANQHIPDAGALPTIAGETRLAIADPAHVPAGIYAREALDHLGLWDTWREQVIPVLDVRAVLAMVELGEADYGIVYLSDAMTSDRVSIVYRFPAGAHEPIRYPAAVSSGAAPDARRFLAYLRSDIASAVFDRHGFIALTNTNHEAESRGLGRDSEATE